MDIETLKSCIGVLAKNIYFCGANENDQNLTIYAKDEKTRIQLSYLLRDQGKINPEFRTIKIETTRSLKLKKTRCLEEIIARVPHQRIYFDPTATIERSCILVSIARDARQLLGSVLKGCYFNSERRNLHFLVKSNSSTLDLAAVKNELEPIIMNNTQRLSQPFYYSITISLEKPQGEVIAIDKASIDDRFQDFMKGFMRKLKLPLLLVSATSSLGMMTAAKAEDGAIPAVSKVNGWVGIATNYFKNNLHKGWGGNVEGGIAAPVGPNLGAQLHTYDGWAGPASVGSVDGYVFWRCPTQGLFGPHVLYTKSNSFHHTLYGLHGEGYVDNWTLVIEGGGASRSNHKNGYYGEALIHWYAQPDWRLYVGAISLGGDVTGQVGTEYQFGLSCLPGLSVFADAGTGAHNLSYGFLGLRYYFGDAKPLMCRQREDMVLPTIDPIDPRHEPRISHI